MQNMIVGLSETPGRIRFPGPEKAEHNHEIYGDRLGLSEAEIAELTERGVI
jgi:formyl-CoA transferase